MISLRQGDHRPAHEGIGSFGMSCALVRTGPLTPTELRSFAAALISAVSKNCYTDGAVDVGHIKAYIKYEEGFLIADTVGDSSKVTVDGRDGSPVDRFLLVMNAVVYGLDKAGVRKAAEDSLERTARAFSLSIERTDDLAPGNGRMQRRGQ